MTIAGTELCKQLWNMDLNILYKQMIG